MKVTLVATVCKAYEIQSELDLQKAKEDFSDEAVGRVLTGHICPSVEVR